MKTLLISMILFTTLTAHADESIQFTHKGKNIHCSINEAKVIQGEARRVLKPVKLNRVGNLSDEETNVDLEGFSKKFQFNIRLTFLDNNHVSADYRVIHSTSKIGFHSQTQDLVTVKEGGVTLSDFLAFPNYADQSQYVQGGCHIETRF